ncbi:hypothetical protein D5018_09400 [Parashewanella curva]|uniref:Uncharacterized protein n=1 Tax=Parashewanella curva TaxID=2338552 RepID=A0A3L8PXF7_9GAMM|nr:hypothetical protein [Parashewanella curva]RLV60010.1 hypothetical protein D5018_09400 [Parashewanella curva]
MDVLTLVLTGLSFIYLIAGAIATLYVVISYLLNGYTVFDAPRKPSMPFRYKVSYIFVMLNIFPYFYIAFIKEILSLHKNVALGKAANSG